MGNFQDKKNTDQIENDDYIVPGRVSLDELHKQSTELKAAKEAMQGDSKGSSRLFKAVSMYGVAMDFALTLAVPLVIFIFLGKWADEKFNTKYIVIIGIFLAIATSTVAITKQVKKLSNFIKKP
jgi:uncharacterized membrane protein YqjE